MASVVFALLAVSVASPRQAGTMSSEARPALVGFDNFVRHNPRSDRFRVLGLDHLEFYCADATTTASRFMHGLDLRLESRLASSSTAHSVSVANGGLRFVFTAPVGPAAGTAAPGLEPIGFDHQGAADFVHRHGVAVRAVCLHVEDAAAAFEACVSNGGTAVSPPAPVPSVEGGARCTFAEVELYGDVVLRLLSSGGEEGRQVARLPGHTSLGEESGPMPSQGFVRVDHVVGNVPELVGPWERIAAMTGFHQFAEFTAEDVGTVDSGLNSIVLASNDETVLLPLNEPTYGTRRKSQIQTYLELNNGPGVQHIALLTTDILGTVREMRKRTPSGGFAFMPRPSAEYYQSLPDRLSRDGLGLEPLTLDTLREAEELGILVDRDDQGVLLQIFTAPVCDRATLFLEIIQRIGCEEGGGEQRGGCGGFGKGNFAELFKRVEEFLED